MDRLDPAQLATEFDPRTVNRLLAIEQAANTQQDEVLRNRVGWEALNQLWPDEDDFIQNCFRIRTKKAGETPLLRYNEGQRILINRIRAQQKAGSPVRVIILKARQIGFSTVCQALLSIRVYRKPHRRAICIADERDKGEGLFRMASFFREALPWKPAFKRTASDRIETEAGSLYSVLTAGNISAPRSITAHEAHASEYGFWLNAEEVYDGLSNAMSDDPDTLFIIESTANGMGNHFYEMWTDAEEGRNDWIPVFMPWWKHSAYTRILDADVARKIEENLSNEELELRRRCELTTGQIAWRRWAIRNKCRGSELTFHQEYPSWPEEAFLFSGTPVFDLRVLAELKEMCSEPKMRGDLVIS